MTDHPLTETAAVELWEERCGYRFTDNTLAALRAAFDAGREHERTNPADSRPWEPLKKGDPLNVGDEVRQDHGGITATAVCSVTDTPPSVMVCINANSAMNPVFQGNGRLCVNVLNHEQEIMARHFAGMTGMTMEELRPVRRCAARPRPASEAWNGPRRCPR